MRETVVRHEKLIDRLSYKVVEKGSIEYVGSGPGFTGNVRGSIFVGKEYDEGAVREALYKEMEIQRALNKGIGLNDYLFEIEIEECENEKLKNHKVIYMRGEYFTTETYFRVAHRITVREESRM